MWCEHKLPELLCECASYDPPTPRLCGKSFQVASACRLGRVARLAEFDLALASSRDLGMRGEACVAWTNLEQAEVVSTARRPGTAAIVSILNP
jgi:hypothetical protein